MKNAKIFGKITAIAAALAALFTLTACQNGLAPGATPNGGTTSSAVDIGRDAALSAALTDAGVAESDTDRLHVAEDNDDGRKFYDIEFTAASRSYDYEIASDGTILSSDVKTLSQPAAQSQAASAPSTSSQSAPAQNPAPASSAPAAASSTPATYNGPNYGANNGNGNGSGNRGSCSPALSLAEASQIVLARVPGATEQNLRIELDHDHDHDHGRCTYEGEIHYNGSEYEFELDANTGTVLEWSQEDA